MCDLAGLGGFTLDGSSLSCNGEPAPDPGGFLEVTGSTVDPSVVMNAHATILLRGVSSSTSSLTITNSAVTLLFEGASQFGGVLCGGGSNVTVGAIGSGILDTHPASGPGLGASGSVCGTLAIVNGSIRAQAESASAGIGTASSAASNIGTLRIENANVSGCGTTSGSWGGAGIGTGSGTNGAGRSRVEVLWIANANVTGSGSANGNTGGAGIGSGVAYNSANSGIGTLTIEKSNVTGLGSTAGSNAGSGIGTGSARDGGKSNIGTLRIESANVSGYSSCSCCWGGAGIGTGTSRGGGADAGIGVLSIANANVTGSTTAPSEPGSGIGTGSSMSRTSAIGSLMIENVNASAASSPASAGGSAIGTGYWPGEGNTGIGALSLVGRVSLFCDSVRAPSVSIVDASVFVYTPGAKVFEAAPVLSGNVFLMVLYGTPKAEAQESALVVFPSISIGNLSLPDNGLWRFCVSGAVCSPSAYHTTRGLFILVANDGPHSIIAEGSSRGFLGLSESENTFSASSSNESFVSTAYFNTLLATPLASNSPSPNATPTPARSSTPVPSASPVPTQTWPPIEEAAPEEWKPVRYVLLILAAVAALALAGFVAGDVTRVMKRRAFRPSENTAADR